ncbi:MAG: exosortase C-terminal domain/associated protein EpsI [Bryobacteraceae bacterium]|jgi:EpsI family protein
MTKNPYVRVVTVLLLLEAVAFYAFASRQETTPPVQPLVLFPSVIGDWLIYRDFPLDQEVLDVLKADDTLNRFYVDQTTRELAGLYIAYFKTQRYGQAPHSPKNCLPGSGWEPVKADFLSVRVPGWDAPIKVNRYVVERGDEKSVTLYWYQSHNRVIATEYAAKFWAVADSIRYRRSDTALVRIMVPVGPAGVERAEQTAVSFTQAVFPALLRQLPL